MCSTPLEGTIMQPAGASRRKSAARRATARATTPQETSVSHRPRRAMRRLHPKRIFWDDYPCVCRKATRVTVASMSHLLAGLIATGGWDPAFVVARRRYLARHPNG